MVNYRAYPSSLSHLCVPSCRVHLADLAISRRTCVCYKTQSSSGEYVHERLMVYGETCVYNRLSALLYITDAVATSLAT